MCVCVCVCVCIFALDIWHAKYIFSVICDLLGCVIFSTLSDAFPEKVIKLKMCGSIFSGTLSEILTF